MFDNSTLILLLITLNFAFILFGNGFIVNIVFSLDRIAFKAFKVLSASNTLFNDNILGNSVLQPLSVANFLAT